MIQSMARLTPTSITAAINRYAAQPIGNLMGSLIGFLATKTTRKRRPGWLGRSLSWCALALFVAGPHNALADPTQLPSLGDASSRLISPQLEKQIGESFLKQIHATLPTADDPLIKYFVEGHVTELAQHSDLRDAIYSIVVIDNPDINAFAAPGGVLGINLGLILAAHDVHEYSSVMAPRIGAPESTALRARRRRAAGERASNTRLIDRSLVDRRRWWRRCGDCCHQHRASRLPEQSACALAGNESKKPIGLASTRSCAPI